MDFMMISNFVLHNTTLFQDMSGVYNVQGLHMSHGCTSISLFVWFSIEELSD